MVFTTILYFAASLLIAYLGRDHKWGPSAWFLVSLLFTPLIASLLILIARDKQEKEQDKEEV